MNQQDLFGKDRFLASLRGKGKYKYSRYRGLPLRYAGGKSLGVGHIVEHIPADTPLMVSPFVGGGAVEIACAKELGIPVKAYDVFDILTNYWQVQIGAGAQLADRLGEWRATKTQYERIKKRLKRHWDGKKAIDCPVDLAAHYWFNHNLSYGPGFLGWMSKIYQCPKKYARAVNNLRAFSCPLLSVESASFEQSIPQHTDAFLYCDPPYFLDDGKMFKGIYPQRNFPVHHNGFKHEVLRDLLHAHEGGFVLSYNDCDTIRQWYSDFRIIEVRWQYTLGQGETRIGKNRKQNGTDHTKKSHELLIVKGGAHG